MVRAASIETTTVAINIYGHIRFCATPQLRCWTMFAHRTPECITCITSSSSGSKQQRQQHRRQRPRRRAPTNPIYVFILPINIWKMRHTECMHFNLITLTCIAHLIQCNEPRHISAADILWSIHPVCAQWEPFLFTHIFLSLFFLFLRVLHANGKTTFYQRSIGNRYAKPFFHLKNENWHKLMASLLILRSEAAQYTTWHDALSSVYSSSAGASGYFGHCGKVVTCTCNTYNVQCNDDLCSKYFWTLNTFTGETETLRE